MAAPRHPSDADRERAAAPVLERYRAAVSAGDAAALRAVLAEGCVWLAEAGRLEGPEAVAAHHVAHHAARPPGSALEWTRVQAQGAHAALGYALRKGDRVTGRGLVVVEVRRETIVFGADQDVPQA